MAARLPSWRSVFRTVHLWLGIGLALLIVPITLTGLVLVFDDEVDALLHPALYATTGPAMARPADEYLRNAAAAVGHGSAAMLRWPAEAGRPVTAMVRLDAEGAAAGPGPGGGRTANRGPGAPEGGRRPPTRLVYLDPPTAAVLGVVDFRASLIGQVHIFHENLMLPQYSGRQIVGWAGVALLLLSVTGLVIWLPRNAGLLRALAWRRGPTLSINLHHLAGFWIAIPLGLLAFTGIVLAFPPQASALLHALDAPDAPRPPPRRFGADPLMARPALTAQQALAAGQAGLPAGAPRALALPAAATQAWRLELTDPDGARRSVAVADATGQASLEPPQGRGDAVGAWMRRVHEGRHHGPVWMMLAGLGGGLPTLLAVTGLLMWLRKRRNRASLRARTAPLPAEPLVPAGNG